MMTARELWNRFFLHQTRCHKCACYQVKACPVGQALVVAARRAEKIEVLATVRVTADADATGSP